MPVSSHAHRGVGPATASGTTVSVSPSVAVAAGQILVARCVSDDMANPTADRHTVADSKGNTWVKLHEQQQAQTAGTAADGVIASLWACRVTTAILTSDTVTLTIGAAVAHKLVALEEFTPQGAVTAIAKAGSNGANGAAATAVSVTLSGLSAVQRLWLGHVGFEGSSTDGYTQDADYLGNTSVGTGSGGNATTQATFVSSRFGYRAASLASDTFNPTLGTARDFAAMLAALDVTLAITASGSATATAAAGGQAAVGVTGAGSATVSPSAPAGPNLAAQPEAMDQAPWVASNLTITPNQGSGQYATADLMPARTGAFDSVEQIVPQATLGGDPKGRTWTVSVTAIPVGGASATRLYLVHRGVAGHDGPEIALPGGAQRISWTATFANTGGTGDLAFGVGGTPGMARDVLFWGWKLEEGPSATAYGPGSLGTAEAPVAAQGSATVSPSATGQAEVAAGGGPITASGGATVSASVAGTATLPGSSLTLADFIGLAGLRLDRAAHVAAQMSGEASFKGFTDLTGFTTVTVTTTDQLIDRLSDRAAGSKTIIECAWTGENVSVGGGRPTGIHESLLTVNVTSDFAYNRSNTDILVRPAAGHTPTIRAIYNNGGIGLDCVGLSRVEFRELGFSSKLRISRQGNFPERTIAAVNACRFLGPDASLETNMARSIHAEGCLWDGCNAMAVLSCQYNRLWGSTVRNHGTGDVVMARGWTEPDVATWSPRMWVAGTLVHDFVGGAIGSHTDFYQSSNSNREYHQGASHLIEFNITIMWPGVDQTQGIFADDINALSPKHDVGWMVHNNLVVVFNSHGTTLFDPSQDARKWVHRNLYARVGKLVNADNPNPNINSGAWPDPLDPAGLGFTVASENYVALINPGQSTDDDNAWGNITMVATMASMAALLTGNGSWALDGNGQLIYSRPEGAVASITDTAAKRAAIDAFYEPLVGWRGAGAGPIDLASWPTSGFDALAEGGPSVPDPFTKGAWSLTDAATGGTLSVTIARVPANGGAALSAIQYRVNGGAWTASGLTAPGSFNIAGLANGTAATVELRATNAVGDGASFASKTATPTGSGLTASGGGTVAPAASGAAAVGVAGSGSAGATPSGSGQATDPVAGSGGGTVGAGAWGAAAAPVAGSGSATAAPAASGQAADPVTGAGGGTVAPAATGQAADPIAGSGGGTVSPAASGQAVDPVTGTGGGTASPSASGTAVDPSRGTGGGTVSPASSGEAGVGVSGTGGGTTTADADGTAAAPVTAQGGATVSPAASGSADGVLPPIGATGAASVAGVAAGQGTVGVTGAGGGEVDPAASGAAAAPITGQGGATVAPSASGTADGVLPPLTASGGATVAPAAGGAAAVRVEGQGAAQAAPGASGAAGVEVQGQGGADAQGSAGGGAATPVAGDGAVEVEPAIAGEAIVWNPGGVVPPTRTGQGTWQQRQAPASWLDRQDDGTWHERTAAGVYR